MAIVFRDHTLSDLIGFGYQSWDSRDAANDLLSRHPRAASARADGRQRRGGGRPGPKRPPLVTIALDGENAWEYYPHDGRDFLHYLYEGLAADPAHPLRHGLRAPAASHPATEPLDWLHTGSWIGGDLRTWSGDPGHNAAWDLLHDARDLRGPPRRPAPAPPASSGRHAERRRRGRAAAEAAWRHILVAEGSDWFWWFGEHHHTELDYVWDLEFRQHLQEVYRRLGEPVPVAALPARVRRGRGEPARRCPQAPSSRSIDGRLTDEDGWDAAGRPPARSSLHHAAGRGRPDRRGALRMGRRAPLPAARSLGTRRTWRDWRST